MGDIGQEAFGQVVLVDHENQVIGACPKLEAHQEGGQLHRAFSIFLFDRDERLLLQQRAHSKYHFGGLWTNTCCSHPPPGEALQPAAERRLFQEMGLRAPLQSFGALLYRARDRRSGLVEHELDLLLRGVCNEPPEPAPDEVADVRWISAAELRDALLSIGDFTPWFAAALVIQPDLRRWLWKTAEPPRDLLTQVNDRWELCSAEAFDTTIDA